MGFTLILTETKKIINTNLFTPMYHTEKLLRRLFIFVASFFKRLAVFIYEYKDVYLEIVELICVLWKILCDHQCQMDLNLDISPVHAQSILCHAIK